MQKVTGEQLKEAMIKAGIIEVNHHQCGICNEWTYYFRVKENIYFNSGCGCCNSKPQGRSWDSVAEWVNQQSNDRWKIELAAKFGLVIEVKYGFYSAKHAEYNKCNNNSSPCYYQTPDGTKVIVTSINDSKDFPEYKWPDKLFVGEITEFIGHVK